MNTTLPCLALLSLAAGHAARAAEPDLQPFVAEYEVHYGSMTVGSSRTELARAAEPGRWVMESRSTASGIARMIAGGTLVQRSTFEATDQGLRPLRYLFDDGTRRTSRDVSLEFDWAARVVRGTAEDEPVGLETVPGLQDAASMQAVVLSRLRRGEEPGTVPMIEKDRIKVYEYRLVRREKLDTALGPLDTVVYRSSREGSDRETLTWFAPSLGWAVVRAEQWIDGKRRGFQTVIRRYQPAP